MYFFTFFSKFIFSVLHKTQFPSSPPPRKNKKTTTTKLQQLVEYLWPSVNVFTKEKCRSLLHQEWSRCFYVCVSRLAWEFVSEVGASIQCRAKLEKNIYIFGIIFTWIRWFLLRFFLLLLFFRCLPPYNFDAYLCAPWVYSHQLFVPVYFQINSVCKSIHACNYCRLRDRSMDPP